MPKTVVPGEGDPHSRLWLIGRDPGENEERRGRPFVGRAGQILDAALGDASLLRRECYIDNIVQVRPPQNEWERHNVDDIRFYSEQLKDRIRREKPGLVVALGNEATQVCLDRDPLGKLSPGVEDLRGYLWDSPLGVRVLTATHPAHIDRNWVPWRKLLEVDLGKAKREVDAGCPPYPDRKVKIISEISEARDVKNLLQNGAWLSVDIENSDSRTLSCLGVAASTSLAYVIPAVKAWQVSLIQEICESEAPKVLQNGQYDRYFLRTRNSIELRNQVFDVMLAWHAWQPELAGAKEDSAKRKKITRKSQKSLRFLASVFTRDPWFKDYNFATQDEQYVLCGKDCCITLEIARILEKKLEAK